MAVTQAFRDAVKRDDLLSVHIMMKDSLLREPSFEEFTEMESIAKHMKNLYTPHDGYQFIKDSSKWDDNYMNELMVDLIDNFSHERVNHLKQVILKLHPYSKSEIKRNIDDKMKISLFRKVINWFTRIITRFRSKIILKNLKDYHDNLQKEMQHLSNKNNGTVTQTFPDLNKMKTIVKKINQLQNEALDESLSINKDTQKREIVKSEMKKLTDLSNQLLDNSEYSKKPYPKVNFLIL